MRGSYDGKYVKLYIYLRDRERPEEEMTFEQIEKVLGFQLPESAREYPAWWANQQRGQSLAWESAGYRTTAVNLSDRRLTFKRVDQPDLEVVLADVAVEDERPLNPLTIAEAKQRLALTFGVDPSQIEITIRA